MKKSGFKLNKPINRKRDIIICVLLAASILLIYGQVIHHEFVNYDDDLYVTKNVHVQNGLTWGGIKWAFSLNEVVYLHPLTWLSHMLDVQLYGMDPGWHHLTNVWFHIVNCILLFLILKRMTGEAWCSAFVAALFAIHPINVESVVWVAERKNVLSTFFWMLTLWCYIRYVAHPGIARYFWAFLFFILGLLTKPMLVTLPFALLLLDFWPLGRMQADKLFAVEKQRPEDGFFRIFQISIPNRLILEKIPFLAVSLVAIFLSSLSVHRLGIVLTYESNPVGIRIANAMVSYIKYLGKIFWPTNFAFIYPYPHTLPVWQVFGAVLLLICLTIFVLLKIKTAPFGGVGWFWYLGTLVPVLGLVQAGFWPAMADRFIYIPAIGIFIIIAWGASRRVNLGYQGKTVLSAAAVVIFILLMTLTWAQVGIWRNSTSLFQHAIKVTENNYMVHNNLGNIYFNQGLLDEAVKHYSESLRINPAFALAHNNLGAAMFRSGKIEDAIFHFRQAALLEPGNLDAYRNLKKMLRLRDLTSKNFKP
jgi:hypothetical protein